LKKLGKVGELGLTRTRNVGKSYSLVKFFVGENLYSSHGDCISDVGERIDLGEKWQCLGAARYPRHLAVGSISEP
jgi:hypothetical protein